MTRSVPTAPLVIDLTETSFLDRRAVAALMVVRAASLSTQPEARVQLRGVGRAGLKVLTLLELADLFALQLVTEAA